MSQQAKTSDEPIDVSAGELLANYVRVVPDAKISKEQWERANRRITQLESKLSQAWVRITEQDEILEKCREAFAELRERTK